MQMAGRLFDKPTAEAVQFHGVVAEKIVCLRSNEEGRIGEDEVELLVRHRCEAVSSNRFDVFNSIESSVEIREGDRPLVEIGGCNGIAETRRYETENSAAGPQIQCRPGV